MASRPALLVLLLVAATTLAGCSDDSPSNYDPPGDDVPPEEPADPLGDLIGQPGGIDVDDLPDPTAPGTLSGFVYEPGNGAPVEGATVFATCLRAEFIPGFTELATTNATGAFTLAAPGSLAGCEQVTYEVQALGFTLQVPLTSGPIEDGTATTVYAAVEPLGLPAS